MTLVTTPRERIFPGADQRILKSILHARRQVPLASQNRDRDSPPKTMVHERACFVFERIEVCRQRLPLSGCDLQPDLLDRALRHGPASVLHGSLRLVGDGPRHRGLLRETLRQQSC